MTHKRALNARKKQVIKQSVSDILARAGFERKGLTCRRQMHGVQHVVDIQALPWNNPDEICFAINCGIHVAGVRKAFTGRPESAEPEVWQCIIGTRPGSIAAPMRRQSWILAESDGPERQLETVKEISAIVEEIILPFFQRFPDAVAVGDFLAGPRSKIDMQIDPQCESLGVTYASIIWDQLGEYDKCRDCMTKAAELAKGKRLEADIEKFAREYVCGQFPVSLPRAL
jgi:hypothetical protein